MSFFRTLAHAVVLWGKENALDLLSVIVIPSTARASVHMFGPQPTRFAATNALTAKTLNGAVIGTIAPQGKPQYAIPKAIAETEERALLGTNQSQLYVPVGYGKRVTRVMSNDKVVIKLGTKLLIQRLGYSEPGSNKPGVPYYLLLEEFHEEEPHERRARQ